MKYEIISSKFKLPIQINFLKNSYIEKQYNKHPKIYLSINDNLIIEVKEKEYNLNKNDIIIINGNILHRVKTKDALIIEIVLDSDYFGVYYNEFEKIIFEELPLCREKYGENVNLFKKKIIDIIHIFNKTDEKNCLLILKDIIAFSNFMIETFVIGKRKDSSYIYTENNKIKQIIDFIDKNYSSEISLKEVADIIGINPQYLSRFFKVQVGIGFLNYVNKVRVEKSLKQLTDGNESILEIAIDNGFNDNKNYTRAFKHEFEMTPGEYRKKIKLNNEEMDFENKSLNTEGFNDSLMEFINGEGKETSFEISAKKIGLYKEISLKESQPYDKHWSKIMAFERAYTLTKQDVQGQIRTIKAQMNFEYLKFCGIFNDEMMIYNEDDNGNVIYNWRYADAVFDFLKEIKIKPFINVGYMPEQLASKKQYIFFYRANVSYPKSIERWNEMVEAFVEHVIKRYGKSEVETWYFEVWNNPNIDNMYWYEGADKYFLFFKNTHDTIKKLSSKIRVGAPSIIINSDTQIENSINQWILKFLNYLTKNKVKLDFFTIHSYPIMPLSANESMIKDKLRYKTFRTENECSIRNINSLKNDIECIEETLVKNYNDFVPVIVSEWSTDPLMGNSINDTCFAAANIIYNMLINIDKAEAIVYWSVSDIFEEYGANSKMFHGGSGLFTNNGLKKASYNAYYILNKLGNKLISQGEGYFIAQKEDSYQIVLYNYTYFDELSCLNLDSKIKPHIYNCYKSTEDKQFDFCLKDIKKGTYKIKKTYLNRKSGSIFDAWMDMGAPEYMDDEVLELIKAKQKMDLFVATVEIENEFIINEAIEAHGILLLEIENVF